MRYLFVLLAVLMHCKAFSTPSPLEVIEVMQSNISKGLQQYPEIAQQDNFLGQLVNDQLLRATDTAMMTKKVLGDYAGRASAAQTVAMDNIIRQRLIRDLSTALHLYSDPEFINTGLSRGNGDKAWVTSLLQDKTHITRLEYKLVYLGHWKVTDISIDGRSLIQSYRSEMEKALKSTGLAQTIAALDNRFPSYTASIRLGAHAWGPYLATNMPNRGLAADIVLAAFGRTGYDVQLVFAPEQKLANQIDQGDLTGDIAAWPTDSERDDRYYSVPYLYNRLVFVKRRDDPFHVTDISSIRNDVPAGNYRLGLYDDVDYGSDVNRILDLFVVEKRDYCSQLIRDVANKSLDIALIDQWAGSVELRNTPSIADHLTLLTTPLVERSLHVTIARSAPDAALIVEAFNAGLDMIQQDGTYESLLKQYNYLQ